MTTAHRAERGLLAMAALLVSVVGCAGEGASESSCAYLVTYKGRAYLGTEEGDFTVGGKLGTATVPSCDDTPGDGEAGEPETTTTVYAVEGKDPADLVAVGDGPAGAVLAQAR
jgi:hypothetical protein